MANRKNTVEQEETVEREPVTTASDEAEQDAGKPEGSTKEPGQDDRKPEESAQEQGAGKPEESAQEQLTLVYIGPSLPYGKLRSSMILKGTQEEIDGFLAEIREQYPEVTHLLVPPDKLTQALEKVGRKGTILHKYYEDMLAKSRASRKGQG